MSQPFTVTAVSPDGKQGYCFHVVAANAPSAQVLIEAELERLGKGFAITAVFAGHHRNILTNVGEGVIQY